VTNLTVDVRLDVQGMICPMPLLKAKKALNGMRVGQVLEVIATDSGSVRDFVAFTRQTGHELLVSREDAGVYYHVLRKA